MRSPRPELSLQTVSTPLGSVRFLPAGENDFEELRRIHRSAMYDGIAGSIGWDDEVQKQRLARHWRPEDLFFLDLNGSRVGTVNFSCRFDENKSYWFLEQFYLLPQLQNKSMGSSILHALCEQAESSKMPVKLKVMKGSRAVSLYERLGFVKYGHDQYQDFFIRH